MSDQNLPPLSGMQGMSQAQPENTPQGMRAGQGGEQESLSHMISDLDRRLRVLEERYSNLRKKIQLSDQNLIESERSFIKEIHTANDEIMELKRGTNDFSEKILLFQEELRQSARKQDVKILEKYLLLWSPQQFVTRTELKEYLKSRQLLESEHVPDTMQDQD